MLGLSHRPHAMGELLLQMAKDNYNIESVTRDMHNIRKLTSVSNTSDMSVIQNSLNITSEYAKDV